MSSRPTDLALLEEALEAMLFDNENITARAAIRRLAGTFKHATDITRRPPRRALLEQYQKRQIEIRLVKERTNKGSNTNLALQLAKTTEELAERTRLYTILMVSHKAMIL